MSSHITNISKIIEFLNKNGEIINENSEQEIYGFNSIHNSQKGDISFCSFTDDRGVELIKNSNASLIICSSKLKNKNIQTDSTLIFVNEPKLWFIRCSKEFLPKQSNQEIHETAIIESNHIGKNTSIGAFSYIENEVEIGQNCVIFNNVQIFNGTKIGNNTIIYPSVVIGDSCFSPQRNKSLKLESCRNLGGVVIGNDVEVGSNTSILAGFLDDTYIDDGTKISSQVYIGSGMKIGKNCMITGKTYFGGSSILEDNVYVGPGSTIRNGIKLFKNSFIGMGSVVVKDVSESSTVIGNPAKYVSHNSDPNAINNLN